LLFVLFCSLAFFIYIKNINFKKSLINKDNIDYSEDSSYDILNPEFTINNNKEKITVTANEGNFMENNQIFLKNNVIFESDKFMIKSSEVYFNQTNQTASSQKKSLFSSKGTLIDSEGFSIEDGGNNIKFYGKTKLKLLR